MTMDITLEAPPGPATKVGATANAGASYLVASGQVAVRTLKKFWPTCPVAGFRWSYAR